MSVRVLLPAIGIAAIGLLFFYLSGQTPEAAEARNENATPVSELEEEAPAELDEFGFADRGYRRIDLKIKRNQTVADLLVPYGVSYETIVKLASRAKSSFDIRKLRANNDYRLYLDDSLATPLYMVYQQDPIKYVVFDLHDTLDARVEEREVTTVRKTISGTIESSLYETLIERGASPMLAIELSEVYAWQVDFYRIQRGDAFKVIYDELMIGDERIGVGTIHAARFNHIGNDYFAFHFEEDDVDEYYDEMGASLRKAFLIAPVRYSRISSGFTSRRFHPVQKVYKSHLGTDYVAPAGTPIVATGDGVVVEARFKGGNGNWVKIRHNSTYSTGYLHMSRIASGMRPGVAVKQGQVIGYVGHTGLATGDHVCYRFWKNGTQVNHRRQKIPSVGPIPDSYRASFESSREIYLSHLLAKPEPVLNPAYAMLLGYSDNAPTTGP